MLPETESLFFFLPPEVGLVWFAVSIMLSRCVEPLFGGRIGVTQPGVSLMEYLMLRRGMACAIRTLYDGRCARLNASSRWQKESSEQRTRLRLRHDRPRKAKARRLQPITWLVTSWSLSSHEALQSSRRWLGLGLGLGWGKEAGCSSSLLNKAPDAVGQSMEPANKYGAFHEMGRRKMQ